MSGIRLRQRDPGLHARENDQPVKIVVDLLGFENQGAWSLSVVRSPIPGGRTPIIGIDLAIQMNFAADDVRVAAEVIAPQSIGENNDVIFARHGFVG